MISSVTNDVNSDHIVEERIDILSLLGHPENIENFKDFAKKILLAALNEDVLAFIAQSSSAMETTARALDSDPLHVHLAQLAAKLNDTVVLADTLQAEVCTSFLINAAVQIF
jgi:hypothetical protein